MDDVTGLPRPLRCPACGGSNDEEAVFCAHCHKALGEFPFALEEEEARWRWHERAAQSVARFIGRPHFLAAHALWFALWAGLNTGALAAMFAWGRFDAYPFQLLGILLSMEAVFITGFLLINQNCQAVRADTRAELDYRASVLTYRKLRDIEGALLRTAERLDRMEDVVLSAKERSDG